MKKVVLTLMITLMGLSLFAQNTPKRSLIAPQFEYHPNKKKVNRTVPAKETTKTKKVGKSILTWKDKTQNLGQIDHNQPATGVFEFVNTGKQPIIIKDAKGSCGCTDTTFPKTAILPGETAQITATYDAKNIGPFKKTVTVYTNIDEGGGTILNITGEVIWRL